MMAALGYIQMAALQLLHEERIRLQQPKDVVAIDTDG
jgi:hypothetical protein